MCRDVNDLKDSLKVCIVMHVSTWCTIAKEINKEWLKKNLPLAEHGNDIVGDGVIATFRVEPKRFLLYALDEVLCKAKAEPLIQVIKTRGVQEPSTFSYSS